MKNYWHIWLKKYFSTKFKNFNSGFFLVENFFLPYCSRFFSLIKLKRHRHFNIPKKNLTSKSKIFILKVSDLQSLKWNGHAAPFRNFLKKDNVYLQYIRTSSTVFFRVTVTLASITTVIRMTTTVSTTTFDIQFVTHIQIKFLE
jgi:hypothetical protein